MTPDVVLVIDDAYFFGQAWCSSMQMTAGDFQVYEINEDWMVRAHNRGAIPRPPELFEFNYFATQPRLFVNTPGFATEHAIVNNGRLQNIHDVLPTFPGAWTRVPPRRPGKKGEVCNGFFDEVRGVVPKPIKWQALGNAYAAARTNIWAARHWCKPFRSTPLGLWYFKAHDMYIPHGSPFPHMSPEVLIDEVWMADHPLSDYIGYQFLVYNNHNYRVGLPERSCAIIDYSMESADIPGLIYTSAYSFFFPDSPPLDIIPLFSQKYENMRLPERHACFRERMSHVPTLGVALHERMLQVVSDATAAMPPMFHMQHGAPSAILPAPDIQAIADTFNITVAVATEFVQRLMESRQTMQNSENIEVDAAVDFRLANVITADRIVQMLSLIGYSENQLEYIEYSPLVCPVRGQEMIMVFPFLLLTDNDDRVKIKSIMSWLVPVPQTQATLLDPGLKMARSVYPLMVDESVFMFVAEAIHSGTWQRHDDTVFAMPRREQEELYSAVRGAHIIRPVLNNYINHYAPRCEVTVHLVAAIVNLRDKVISKTFIDTAMKRVDVTFDNWFITIVKETRRTDVSGIRISACLRGAGDTHAACGCSLTSMMSTYSCKTNILRLLSMISLRVITPIVYRVILCALLRVKFSDSELLQISRVIVPRGEDNMVIDDNYPPWSPALAKELTENIIFKYLNGMTIGWFARRSSEHPFRQWQRDLMTRYMRAYDDVLRKDFIVAEMVAFKMCLDYISVNGKDERTLLYFNLTGYESQFDIRNSMRVLAMNEVKPLLKERLDQIEQEIQATGEDERVRLKQLQKSMMVWNSAVETICRFGLSRELKHAVTEILLDPEPMDKIYSLFRCNNVVLWGDRFQKLVHILPGLPQFKLMKSCKINYNPNYSMNDAIVKETMQFFRRMFELPFEEGENKFRLLNHVFELLSRAFDGEPAEKWKYFLKGPGDNGKTSLAELLKFLFGDYFVTSSNAFFMRSQDDPGKATPHFFKILDARMVSTAEPKETQIYDGSKVKLFASPEDVDFRKLFGESGTFHVTMRFITFTNHWPLMDGGGWQAVLRFHFIPMETRFAPNAPADPLEQYQQRHYLPDEVIHQRLKHYAEPALFIIAQHYRGGIKEDIPETSALFEQYLHTTEPVHMFCEEWITDTPPIYTGVIPPVVNLKHLYTKYKEFLESIFKFNRQPQLEPEFEKTLLAMGKSIKFGIVEFIQLNATARSSHIDANNATVVPAQYSDYIARRGVTN